MITVKQAAVLAEARGILEAIQDRASEIDTYESGMVGARAGAAETGIFDTLNSLASYYDHPVAAAVLYEVVPAELMPAESTGEAPADDDLDARDEQVEDREVVSR